MGRGLYLPAITSSTRSTFTWKMGEKDMGGWVGGWVGDLPAITSSTRSAFTWKIGALTLFPMSVQ